jgi:hypothetical protein
MLSQHLCRNKPREYPLLIDFSSFNWFALLASVVAGQVISTVWFTVLFGEAWAAEYGVATKQEHTSKIPGYTYGVGLVCTVVLVLSIAVLQGGFAIESVGGALGLGLFVAVGLAAATALPGQAFLGRWRVFFLANGSQTVMILAISLILVLLS